MGNEVVVDRAASRGLFSGVSPNGVRLDLPMYPDGLPGSPALVAIYGSWAHGTNTPTSDEDWRGVYLLPNNAFLGLGRPIRTFESPPDQVYWELGHFVSLLLKGNPNIVGMLFVPDDCVALRSSVMDPWFDNRERFIHRGTAAAYMGWISRELQDIGKLHKGHAKRLSHVPRLVWELQDMLTLKTIHVRPGDAKIRVIKDIKTGVMPYEAAMELCGQLLLDTEYMYERRKGELPEAPSQWAEDLLLRQREQYGR